MKGDTIVYEAPLAQPSQRMIDLECFVHFDVCQRLGLTLSGGLASASVSTYDVNGTPVTVLLHSDYFIAASEAPDGTRLVSHAKRMGINRRLYS